MTITRAQRQQAEDNANETQLRLYAEPESGEQLWTIATKYNLTERSTYFTFSQMVGDVILGFYKVDDVGALISRALPQVQGVQKIALEADIKMFLYPLSAQTTVGSVASNSEIIAIEKEIESLQPVRTMSHDMAAIKPGSDVVYQAASQAAILKREAEAVILSDGPTPQTQPPRWDSEAMQ